MTTMNNYLIEPLSPLVFRSGKPFGSQASAQDVIFPLPSAAAGLLRATSIHQNQVSLNEHAIKAKNDQDYQKLLSIRAQGPYLARFDHTYQHIDILVPKPADALYFETKPVSNTDTDQSSLAPATTRLVKLMPKPFATECGSDLPEGLLPVQMSEPIKGKPKAGVAYWTLAQLKQWQMTGLVDTQNNTELDFESLQRDGVSRLPIEIRTHVAIDSKSYASEMGKLFQTANLDLGYAKYDADLQINARTKADDTGTDTNLDALTHDTWQQHRLGFVVQSEKAFTQDMVTFGGERRLSKLIPLAEIESLHDDLDALLEAINHCKGFKLTFLTPCVFANGYLPAWINKDNKQGTLPHTSVTALLRACAIDRWQPVSGWDSILWKPKAMRKAISSGSVYWFGLQDKLSHADLEQLTQYVWSDDEQDQKDGFGNALISPWQDIQS